MALAIQCCILRFLLFSSKFRETFSHVNLVILDLLFPVLLYIHIQNWFEPNDLISEVNLYCYYVESANVH